MKKTKIRVARNTVVVTFSLIMLWQTPCVVTSAAPAHRASTPAAGTANPDSTAWQKRRAAEYGQERDAFYFLVRMMGTHRNRAYRLQQGELGDEPESTPDGLIDALRRDGFDVDEDGKDSQITINVMLADQLSPSQWIVGLGAQDRARSFDGGYYCATKTHGHWAFLHSRGTREDRTAIGRAVLLAFKGRKGAALDGCWFQTPTTAIAGVFTAEPGATDGHMDALVYLKRVHSHWQIASTCQYESGV